MWRRLAPVVLILATTGCARTARVSGTVSYQGRPVLSGCVTILNADGTASSGVIQPDGSYVVEGVRRGTVKIGVVSPDPLHARSILKIDEPKTDHQAHGKASHTHTKPGAGGWYPLPKNLGDPDKSGVVCDVSSSNVTFDINMK
ncbi:MAG TPA: hypothetical protein VKE40_02040 [Gemmataceae bacterium]|nr:hypothetical protein [Gemmataceae bacterium]